VVIRVSASLKKRVRDRAAGRCEYCQTQESFSPQSFSIEHFIPRSKGGETKLENLVLSCQGCNNHKYTKTTGIDPLTGQSVPLFNPRQRDWQKHFSWNDDFTRIVGLTAIGRATVETLKLNRPGLLNLRSVLFAAGEHPPEIIQKQ